MNKQQSCTSLKSKSQQMQQQQQQQQQQPQQTRSHKRQRVDPRLAYYEAKAFEVTEDEYRTDQIFNLKAKELDSLPNAAMIDMQPEIEWYMRPFLLDFILDTHYTLRLSPSTLFLAVNLVDRYCSRRIVSKKHYQLVGCTALWIAAKFEDKKSHIPQLNDLIGICCDLYEDVMFVQMEGHILNTIEWQVSHASVESFLQLLLGSKCNPVLSSIAHYLAEVSMYHKDFFSFRPSVIANCCVALASHILSHSDSQQQPPVVASSYSGMHDFDTPPTTPPHSQQQQQHQLPQNISVLPFSSSPASPEFQCISLLQSHMANPTNSLQRKYMKSAYHQIPRIIAYYLALRSKMLAFMSSALPPSPLPSRSSSVVYESEESQNCDLVPPSSQNVAGGAVGYMTPPRTPSPEEQQQEQQEQQQQQEQKPDQEMYEAVPSPRTTNVGVSAAQMPMVHQPHPHHASYSASMMTVS
ncbi:uncharacterized protein SAPINGB_P002253 [Magnusiomyces paraingens]|uniref:Uncharacterized protein n=1 Tax=Magnusiomyces paraingens TaxID=2606893 RepID=A0A5E8BF79_9ASCO|nr:uncharacterized protein SAPINGB_P002253 [Saprochaete ingens]VVT49402.1 unnamed protein product [Saprochaete ingens]